MTKLYIEDVLLAGSRADAETNRPLIGLTSAGVRGWYSTPGVKDSATPRVGANGDWGRRRVYYSARTVTVPFHVLAEGRAAHVEVWRLLGRFVGEPYRVRYVDHGEDTFITGIIEADLPGERVSHVSTGSFVVTASDPVRYATELQSFTLTSGMVRGGVSYPIEYPIDYGVEVTAGQSFGILENRGNTAGYPVVTVRGSLPDGFTLMDTEGRAIVYADAVLPATPVVVDCNARAVLVQGVNRSWALTRREWFSVPREGSLGISFIPSSAVSSEVASAVVEFRSTYI